MSIFLFSLSCVCRCCDVVRSPILPENQVHPHILVVLEQVTFTASERIAAAFEVAAAPTVQFIPDMFRRHEVMTDRTSHLAGNGQCDSGQSACRLIHLRSTPGIGNPVFDLYVFG
jgi:hypothetical protein